MKNTKAKMLSEALKQIQPLVGGCISAPSGARTLDPNIKSVVLYQLS